MNKEDYSSSGMIKVLLIVETCSEEAYRLKSTSSKVSSVRLKSTSSKCQRGGRF